MCPLNRGARTAVEQSLGMRDGRELFTRTMLWRTERSGLLEMAQRVTVKPPCSMIDVGTTANEEPTGDK